ncbi:MAG: hypothetical protein AAF961_07425 [Planctomycetota bacterium]
MDDHTLDLQNAPSVGLIAENRQHAIAVRHLIARQMSLTKGDAKTSWKYGVLLTNGGTGPKSSFTPLSGRNFSAPQRFIPRDCCLGQVGPGATETGRRPVDQRRQRKEVGKSNLR